MGHQEFLAADDYDDGALSAAYSVQHGGRRFPRGGQQCGGQHGATGGGGQRDRGQAGRSQTGHGVRGGWGGSGVGRVFC